MKATVLEGSKNTLRSKLVNAWLVLAGSGRRVVSESNLSPSLYHIIILKNTPPGAKTPRPFPTEQAQCENDAPVSCEWCKPAAAGGWNLLVRS